MTKKSNEIRHKTVNPSLELTNIYRMTDTAYDDMNKLFLYEELQNDITAKIS